MASLLRKVSNKFVAGVSLTGITLYSIRKRFTGHEETRFGKLNILHDPEGHVKFDILAVHGLNPRNDQMHPEKTWTTDNKIFWLKEFLPERFKDSRIMMYEYNSNIAFGAAAAGIEQHSETMMNDIFIEREGAPNRPLIFICHSLGGLVVEQALLLDDPKFKDIIGSTRGVVFFATPHRGAKSPGLGLLAAQIIRAVFENVDNPIGRALEANSEIANKLDQEFQQKFGHLRYLSFYETRPLGIYGIVVDRQSAVLGYPNTEETKIGLDRNHSDICKFASQEDPDYKKVEDHLGRMLRLILDAEEWMQVEGKLQELPTAHGKKLQDTLQFLKCAASNYQGRRLYEKSEKLNLMILKRAEDDPVLAANTRHNLAYDLKGSGKLEEAEAMFRRALAEREAQSCSFSDILFTRRGIARVIMERGGYSESIKLFQELLEEREKLKPKGTEADDRITLLSCRDLGLALMLAGNPADLADSESYLRRALDGLNRLNKSKDPKDADFEVFRTHNYLGDALERQGKDDESEAEYRSLLEQEERALGVADRNTLSTMRSLASVLKKLGKLADAESLCKRALEGFANLFPAGDNEILTTINLLNFIRLSRGKLPIGLLGGESFE
ncbi:hypothetical protein B0J11DRAFT_581621 [Dendryphion nanum]|uniref:DUF676 domain-containing protein n=1 Tax=Dendryphion nanum TaxID=256645 RepID=A0A9P9IHJ4_9PLEO|nr:hypothetical protein B0J11DRAFT_581621 [Dendryphion nanum]